MKKRLKVFLFNLLLKLRLASKTDLSLRALPMQVKKISEDGESAASLGDLWQCFMDPLWRFFLYLQLKFLLLEHFLCLHSLSPCTPELDTFSVSLFWVVADCNKLWTETHGLFRETKESTLALPGKKKVESCSLNGV